MIRFHPDGKKLDIEDMRCYLPIPFIDELVYSVESRYALRIGASKKGQLSVHIYNRLSRPSVILPASLKTVAERTQLLWGKSGESIAKELTLLPYYSKYLSKARGKLCLDKMLSENGHGIQLLAGAISNRIKNPKLFRFCVTCRDVDIEKYGETYWRRCHQLPGVLVCPDHGKELTDSSAFLKPKGFCDYIGATDATDRIKFGPVRLLNKDERSKALQIARRSRDMLLHTTPTWSSENITESYRKAAIGRGFIEGAIRLSLSKLEKRFVAYYGRRLLRLIQCDFPLGRNSSWFRNIFRSTRKTFHPLQHVLVQLFLESIKTRIADIIPFGLGPWRCPNPYGVHDVEFPITNPQIYVGHKHRKYVASAKCKCGYHFTFQQVDKKDPKLPIVSKVMQYGPTWEAEARRLRNTGISMLATAKTLGVHDNNVKRMLEGRRRVDQVTESDIKQWRKEWLRLLKKVPERSRKLAANKNKALYLRLLRNDRKWLLSEPRRWSHRSKPPRFIDWAGRDDKWSSMLKSAADAVRKATPLKRATRTAIIKEAGLGLKILAKYDRYPKCNSTLDAFSESKEDYRERRMEFRAEEDRRIAA